MVFISSIRRALQQRSRMFVPTPIRLPRDSRAQSQSVRTNFIFKKKKTRIYLFDYS